MTYKTLKKGLTGALVLGGLCALIPVSQSASAQGIGVPTLENMLTPTENRIERGEKVYAENCAQCHGDNGAGGAPFGQQFDPPARGFTDAQYNYGGGPIAVHNAISRKGAVPNHPVFNYLAYQDRWAVTHYVRSLGPTDNLTDPPELLEQAKFEAANGVCDPEIKDSIASQVDFKGDEQLQTGKELYAAQCVSCHGEEGAGNGPAAAALNPAPRNFQAADAKWTKQYGPNPIGIFNTLSNGIEGGSMAAYPNLSADEKYALAHYILRTWVPDEIEEEVDEEAVNAACRAMSIPPKPPTIPTEAAMTFLVEDQPEQDRLGYLNYGPAYVRPTANPQNGSEVYTSYCADCHGPNGAGLDANAPNSDALGPFGSFPPYLYLRVDRLIPAKAGGTVEEFAERSLEGVHATLPNMTAAATLTNTQWADLQAYIAGLKGEGEVVFGPKPTIPAETVLGPDGQPLEPGAAGNPAAAEEGSTPAGSQGENEEAAPAADEPAANPAESGNSNAQPEAGSDGSE